VALVAGLCLLEVVGTDWQAWIPQRALMVVWAFSPALPLAAYVRFRGTVPA
jgi:hypothetical protein